MFRRHFGNVADPSDKDIGVTERKAKIRGRSIAERKLLDPSVRRAIMRRSSSRRQWYL
jgi:hypothetical protein